MKEISSTCLLAFSSSSLLPVGAFISFLSKYTNVLLKARLLLILDGCESIVNDNDTTFTTVAAPERVKDEEGRYACRATLSDRNRH